MQHLHSGPEGRQHLCILPLQFKPGLLMTKETAEKVLENLDVSLTEAKMVAASGKLDNLM